MQTQLRKLTRTIGVLALIAAPIPALAQQPPAAPPPPATSYSSQANNHEGIGIGVKGGFLFSTIIDTTTTVAQNNQYRTGVLGGLFIGGNRAGLVGVGVDLLYARKGEKEADGSTVDMDYINVPVYARINLGSASWNGGSVYGVAGVDLHFLLIV